MKWLLLVSFSCCIIFSCNSEKKAGEIIDYTGLSEKKILLAGIDKRDYGQTDTLGYLMIKIPLRLDTFYQWHNTSDCLPCGSMEYRFADTHYQQFAESGFFYIYQPDSVYQLTITHNPIREAPDCINIRPFTISDTGRYGGYLMDETTFCTEALFLKKEFKEINGRAFAIGIYISPCSHITTNATSLFFTAKTTLRNRYLNFIGECRIRDSACFIDNMYKSILSIRIQEK
jgi:hypothetical protein